MRPDAIFLAAGLVGGIYANNTYPADFIADNLAIALNVIRGAHAIGIRKLLALGSTCIYPKLAAADERGSAIDGPTRADQRVVCHRQDRRYQTGEGYRKQHGCDFISVMPTNLYGPNDNYHLENSHVPAALVRRFTKPN